MRYLTINNVCEKIKLSRSSIYNKINPKSQFHDPSFPKPRRLGKRCVRWDEEEIHNWMKQPGVIINGGELCAPV